MRARGFVLILVAGTFQIAGCSLSAPTPTAIPPTATPFVLVTPTPLTQTLPVIVDTDMGMDDMFAILYLLKHPNVEVRAITVAGTGEAHCEAGIRHALGLLALNDATDVPVACGRETPLVGEYVFPSEWRQRADELYGLSLPERGIASPLSALELIAMTVVDSEEKIFIVATGPLTNVAEALLENPQMVANVRMVYFMGGALKVKGNLGFSEIDNQVAEWNIYIDPRAVNALFDSGMPVTMIPLDATKDAPVTMRFYEMLKSRQMTVESKFVFELMTANLGMVQSGGAQFWDSLTAAIFTDESLANFETMELHVVEDDGSESGYTKPTPGGAKVRVTVAADGLRFEMTFLSVLNLP